MANGDENAHRIEQDSASTTTQSREYRSNDGVVEVDIEAHLPKIRTCRPSRNRRAHRAEALAQQR